MVDCSIKGSIKVQKKSNRFLNIIKSIKEVVFIDTLYSALIFSNTYINPN